MIALSTGSLFTYGTARVARLAAAAGFDGLEIMIDDRWDTRDAAYLAEVARAAGIPILSLHAPFRPGMDGWGGDEVVRVARTVDLARALDARVVVAHPPVRYQWLSIRYPPFINVSALTPFRRRSRYRRWMTMELAAFGTRAGITIAIENMPRHRLGARMINLFDLNEIRDLRELPALTFDTTHLGTWGVDLLDTYQALADRVVHVHLSNYDGRQHRLPQDGRLALGPFLGALRSRGFGGIIVVELDPESSGAGDDRRVQDRLAAAAAFCREHFA